MPSPDRAPLREMALSIVRKSSALSGFLHVLTLEAISKMLSPMNSYYSNSIEGRYSSPVDIDRAMKANFDAEPHKKELQYEGLAHLKTYSAIRSKMGKGSVNPYDEDFMRDVHREFYSHIPKEYHKIKTRNGDEYELIPGEVRKEKEQVMVGNHYGPMASSLPRFLKSFSNRYSSITDPLNRIVAIAASHHRLAWVHPFLDGNGRVARLISDALFMMENLDARGLWTISRGLAIRKENYYAALSNADSVRLNDFDGRGNLSESRLNEFCEFFLSTALDQLSFMTEMLKLDDLLNRSDRYFELLDSRDVIPNYAGNVFKHVIVNGKVTKGVAYGLTLKSEHLARKAVRWLINNEFLIEKSLGYNRDELLVNFPLLRSAHLFPGLYPAKIEAELIQIPYKKA